MNKLLALFIILFSFITLPVQAAEMYNLDPSHSHVAWHVNHFGFSSPTGKWFAEGTLLLDEKNPDKSQVKVTINMANIVTGIPKLDEHLKKKDFFDVEQFPTATFTSDTIHVTGRNTAKVSGMLTIHGVSKPITLDVKLNKIDISPINKKKTAGFTAKAKLKRSDYGITMYLPGLGDEVILDIESEANLVT